MRASIQSLLRVVVSINANLPVTGKVVTPFELSVSVGALRKSALSLGQCRIVNTCAGLAGPILG